MLAKERVAIFCSAMIKLDNIAAFSGLALASCLKIVLMYGRRFALRLSRVQWSARLIMLVAATSCTPAAASVAANCISLIQSDDGI